MIEHARSQRRSHVKARTHREIICGKIRCAIVIRGVDWKIFACVIEYCWFHLDFNQEITQRAKEQFLYLRGIVSRRRVHAISSKLNR
jgi:hypothetical protein